ncbi:hypothetical protein Tneu_0561 [Pyrobaculum neutrophilum V24Sta]|uniref:Uncharacterized protein n=1 Tax=Pyrobaculum neutrophilum (strain DSM 2338 / JCM 9278 / NBRC 100436 / V24Sta) TaxID=444157 RepID=B1YCJ0_PYRNV|nr:hypothetical protein Tneu_0561 [Pyrobaculum neutrophilum V24Sta]
MRQMFLLSFDFWKYVVGGELLELLSEFLLSFDFWSPSMRLSTPSATYSRFYYLLISGAEDEEAEAVILQEAMFLLSFDFWPLIVAYKASWAFKYVSTIF